TSINLHIFLMTCSGCHVKFSYFIEQFFSLIFSLAASTALQYSFIFSTICGHSWSGFARCHDSATDKGCLSKNMILAFGQQLSISLHFRTLFGVFSTIILPLF